MNEEQFAEAIKGTTVQYDVVCRQVSNGFILNGTVRYIDPVPNTVRLAQQYEGVANTASEAASAAGNFILTGTFAQ